MKKFVLMAMVAALVVPAFAAETDLRVSISSTSGVSWPSSPYNITVGAGDWSPYDYTSGDTFQTFCVEWNKNFSNGTYWATVDDVIMHGGSGVAPKDETKMIYAAFLNSGNAIGTFSANDIQREIWYWERGESFTINGVTAGNLGVYTYVSQNASQAQNWEYVKVLNLWNNKDMTGDRQSQLVMTPIPAPGAILLTGIGTTLVGWLRRRRAL